eukprot:CFRG1697T1
MPKSTTEIFTSDESESCSSGSEYHDEARKKKKKKVIEASERKRKHTNARRRRGGGVRQVSRSRTHGADGERIGRPHSGDPENSESDTLPPDLEQEFSFLYSRQVGEKIYAMSFDDGQIYAGKIIKRSLKYTGRKSARGSSSQSLMRNPPVPHYLAHYKGWSSRYEEWVMESQILTDEQVKRGVNVRIGPDRGDEDTSSGEGNSETESDRMSKKGEKNDKHVCDNIGVDKPKEKDLYDAHADEETNVANISTEAIHAYTRPSKPVSTSLNANTNANITSSKINVDAGASVSGKAKTARVRGKRKRAISTSSEGEGCSDGDGCVVAQPMAKRSKPMPNDHSKNVKNVDVATGVTKSDSLTIFTQPSKEREKEVKRQQPPHSSQQLGDKKNQVKGPRASESRKARKNDTSKKDISRSAKSKLSTTMEELPNYKNEGVKVQAQMGVTARNESVAIVTNPKDDTKVKTKTNRVWDGKERKWLSGEAAIAAVANGRIKEDRSGKVNTKLVTGTKLCTAANEKVQRNGNARNNSSTVNAKSANTNGSKTLKKVLSERGKIRTAGVNDKLKCDEKLSRNSGLGTCVDAARLKGEVGVVDTSKTNRRDSSSSASSSCVIESSTSAPTSTHMNTHMHVKDNHNTTNVKSGIDSSQDDKADGVKRKERENTVVSTQQKVKATPKHMSSDRIQSEATLITGSTCERESLSAPPCILSFDHKRQEEENENDTTTKEEKHSGKRANAREELIIKLKDKKKDKSKDRAKGLERESDGRDIVLPSVDDRKLVNVPFAHTSIHAQANGVVNAIDSSGHKILNNSAGKERTRERKAMKRIKKENEKCKSLRDSVNASGLLTENVSGSSAVANTIQLDTNISTSGVSARKEKKKRSGSVGDAGNLGDAGSLQAKAINVAINSAVCSSESTVRDAMIMASVSEEARAQEAMDALSHSQRSRHPTSGDAISIRKAAENMSTETSLKSSTDDTSGGYIQPQTIVHVPFPAHAAPRASVPHSTFNVVGDGVIGSTANTREGVNTFKKQWQASARATKLKGKLNNAREMTSTDGMGEDVDILLESGYIRPSQQNPQQLEGRTDSKPEDSVEITDTVIASSAHCTVNPVSTSPLLRNSESGSKVNPNKATIQKMGPTAAPHSGIRLAPTRPSDHSGISICDSKGPSVGQGMPSNWLKYTNESDRVPSQASSRALGYPSLPVPRASSPQISSPSHHKTQNKQSSEQQGRQKESNEALPLLPIAANDSPTEFKYTLSETKTRAQEHTDRKTQTSTKASVIVTTSPKQSSLSDTTFRTNLHPCLHSHSHAEFRRQCYSPHARTSCKYSSSSDGERCIETADEERSRSGAWSPSTNFSVDRILGMRGDTGGSVAESESRCSSITGYVNNTYADNNMISNAQVPPSACSRTYPLTQLRHEDARTFIGADEITHSSSTSELPRNRYPQTHPYMSRRTGSPFPPTSQQQSITTYSQTHPHHVHKSAYSQHTAQPTTKRSFSLPNPVTAPVPTVLPPKKRMLYSGGDHTPDYAGMTSTSQGASSSTSLTMPNIVRGKDVNRQEMEKEYCDVRVDDRSSVIINAGVRDFLDSRHDNHDNGMGSVSSSISYPYQGRQQIFREQEQDAGLSYPQHPQTQQYRHTQPYQSPNYPQHQQVEITKHSQISQNQNKQHTQMRLVSAEREGVSNAHRHVNSLGQPQPRSPHSPHYQKRIQNQDRQDVQNARQVHNATKSPLPMLGTKSSLPIISSKRPLGSRLAMMLSSSLSDKETA